MSQIPKEGLKLVCIAGYFNGNPIWRTVGQLKLSSAHKHMVILDKTFNPAGVVSETDSATVVLNAVPFSEEELQRKKAYSNGTQPPSRYKEKTNSKPSSNLDDMEDDIPF